MSPDSGASLEVVGGASDPAVRRAEAVRLGYASAERLASVCEAAGGRLLGWSADDASLLADPDLLASSVLAPVSFARVEAALLAATTGPRGTLVAGGLWTADAAAIRGAVALLREQDATAARLLTGLEWAGGFALGHAADLALLAGFPAVVVAAGAMARFPGLRRLAGQGGSAAEEWLVEHPDLVARLAAGGGGVLDGMAHGLLGAAALAALHPTLRDAARDVSRLAGPEGRPRVRPADAPAYAAPRDLRDLLVSLQRTAQAPDGTVGVQEVVGADGQRRWVAYLPGTDDLGGTGDAARDLGTVGHLLGGADTTYGEGVREALHQAGVRPDEPVLLVGHSAGGMQAQALLADPGDLDLRQAVTAGAPDVGGAGRVLALEHRGDLVPALDGRAPVPSQDRVTVRFDDPVGDPTVAGGHDLDHYVRGAGLADDSTDPAVRDQVIRLHGWLGGTPGASYGFRVSR